MCGASRRSLTVTQTTLGTGYPGVGPGGVEVLQMDVFGMDERPTVYAPPAVSPVDTEEGKLVSVFGEIGLLWPGVVMRSGARRAIENLKNNIFVKGVI
jgi:hypothetical protein